MLLSPLQGIYLRDYFVVTLNYNLQIMIFDKLGLLQGPGGAANFVSIVIL